MCTVSVIVRTKDRNLLLQRAIQSIMQQTFVDWEIIIVNNGGNAGELEKTLEDCVRNLAQRIRIVHLTSAHYMEVATNAGIKNSSGTYITLLDDDDTWDETFLQKCISVLQNPRIYAVASQSSLVYESIEADIIQTESVKKFNPEFDRVKLVKLARRNLFTTNAFMYRRELLDTVGLYREDLPVLGDWEFNLRMAMKYNIHVIQESLAFYHKRVPIDNNTPYGNTQMSDHLHYDRKLRREYVGRGFRGEIPFYVGALIYSYSYINQLIRLTKRLLRVR